MRPEEGQRIDGPGDGQTTSGFTTNPISERQCERFYICKNQKKKSKIKKSDTLQKERQLALYFYSQKSRHFPLRDFS